MTTINRKRFAFVDDNSLFGIKLSPDMYYGVLACISYSIFSLSTTFTNKAMFSWFDFRYPLCLLFYQHVFTLVLLVVGRSLGHINLQNIQMKTVTDWYPVNILFIMMLVTGSYALKSLSIPMVTIFKNITTTLVTFGDYLLFGEILTNGILLSISLMIFGSVVAGLNDLAFDFVGYCWMTANCIISAAYVLYMRFAIKKTKLSEWNMVYYNNFLAIPTLFPFLFISELPSLVKHDFSSYSVDFVVVIIICGLSGFFISLCSFWAVKTTSATTYSIVGTLNKIPLTILGFLFFDTQTNFLGNLSIAIGLLGGVLYTYEKQQINKMKESLPR